MILEINMGGTLYYLNFLSLVKMDGTLANLDMKYDISIGDLF